MVRTDNQSAGSDADVAPTARNDNMNEDAGYKFLSLLFANGFYGINEILENKWFNTDPDVVAKWMLGLEERARDVMRRCGTRTYEEAMALLPALKDESSEFLGHGPKFWALAFACGIVAISHGLQTRDFQMATEVLDGSTNNSNVVMDYFGIASLEALDVVMCHLQTEAAEFLDRSEKS